MRSDTSTLQERGASVAIDQHAQSRIVDCMHDPSLDGLQDQTLDQGNLAAAMCRPCVALARFLTQPRQ
ncbi:hypothetical protein XbrCFBP1976_06060 [Xanthomonas bromi]|uniref:Uncharacterized protein n=1 Tax=Xanthomonas bromi TaxID=56449 RepID=A0ABX5BS23_9XANT|nr:hypothetical protein XbrCFBP1976_06060 [Xanthomonas bromi]